MVATPVCPEYHSLMPSTDRCVVLDIEVIFYAVRKNVHDIPMLKTEMPCDIGSDVNQTGR